MRLRWLILGLVLAAPPATAGAQVTVAEREFKDLLQRPARLTVENVPLPDALVALRDGSRVPVAWSPDFVPSSHRVSCRCHDKSVRSALTLLLAGTNLTFEEYGRQIVVQPFGDNGARSWPSRPLEAKLAPGSGLYQLASADVTSSLGADELQQAGSVAGVVVSTRGQPLPGARLTAHRVGATDTVKSVTTDERGRFRIDGLTGTQVTVNVIMIGFRPLAATVRVGDEALRLVLTESVINLAEVVVTGTAGGQEKKAVGNAIGHVSVSEEVQLAPPTKLQDMLSAQTTPGVQFLRAEGQVGSGGRIRIRGSGSLSLSNEPLIYIDGVRVNNESAAPGAYLFIPATSRINDLNPEEIESIEILKGPSAATIYGTEASNGVVQIITKKGRQGRSTFDAHLDGGAAWFMNPEGRYMTHAYIGHDGQIHDFNVLLKNKELGYPSPFSTGNPRAFGGSLSGGTDQLRYYFSVEGSRDEGSVWNNWQNKYNGRANLSYQSVNGKFGVDASLGALRTKTRGPGFQAIVEAITFACLYPGCEPDPADPTHTGWNDGSRGFSFYRPEDYEHSAGWADVDRTTFSLKFSHRPFTWLRHQLTIGPDLLTNNVSTSIDRVAGTRLPFFSFSLGYAAQLEQRSTYFSLDYGASADAKLGKSLVATTSVGTQFYHKQFSFISATGSVFSIPGPSNITGSTQRQASDSFLENKTLGVYGQEQLAWKNRLFFTAALRGDGNSAFGKNFSAVYYPKVSGSWVLSEEPFLAHSQLVSQLRVRAAWGRAGLQPDVFSAIQTFQPKVGPGGGGGVSPQNFGNPDLKPEVGEEKEAGFDLGLFHDRVGLEFTYYSKKVKDAILSAPLKPSGGFPGTQFINIGATQNRGIELGLNARVVEARNVALDFRATLATNDSKILDLGGFPSLLAGLNDPLFGQYHVAGFAPASLFYKRVLRSTVKPLQFGPHAIPVGYDPICEGGTDLGLGNGTEVPCQNAPRLYRGRPTPSWNGSVSSTLTLWNRLRLFVLVEGLGGNTIMSCDAACSEHFYFQTRTSLDGSDPVLAGDFGMYLLQGDATNVWEDGLFKGGFAKLRTISASYDFPQTIARHIGAARASITVSAENLAILWWEQRESHGYRWVDPEIAPYGGDVAFNQENWPQLARFRTTIRLSF